MAKTTSFALGDHFAEFIDQQVESGRFGSASEVVRAGLRLLEENEEKLRILREAINEGHRSGRVENFDVQAFLAEKRRNFKA
jgi:antitoxin ParD1/3/4